MPAYIMHHLVGKDLLIKKNIATAEICGMLVIPSSTSQHDQKFVVMAPRCSCPIKQS